uniref:Uncharacterized protein n=1 Tax=Engystomops pustulosus TaxID=76066 RepID=A0AAV6YHS3_ENGPU|nr:hypothetical protein GDO81_027980 [Engystomops pustulosus]
MQEPTPSVSIWLHIAMWKPGSAEWRPLWNPKWFLLYLKTMSLRKSQKIESSSISKSPRNDYMIVTVFKLSSLVRSFLTMSFKTLGGSSVH